MTLITLGDLVYIYIYIYFDTTFSIKDALVIHQGFTFWFQLGFPRCYFILRRVWMLLHTCLWIKGDRTPTVNKVGWIKSRTRLSVALALTSRLLGFNTKDLIYRLSVSSCLTCPLAFEIFPFADAKCELCKTGERTYLAAGLLAS